MKKTAANRYMPGVVDITKDLCEVMSGGSAFFLISFIKMVYKSGLEQFKSFFKECPYSVSENSKRERDRYRLLTLSNTSGMHSL
jgi:hypothetical protein